MKIRILIADDHRLLREGVKQILESEEDLCVVAEAADGASALQQASQLKPEIALLDISMPKLNGIEAAAAIRAAVPETEVVILSMHAERDYLVKALKAGVKGYLVKSCAGVELASAIRSVARKETYLSPTVSAVLASEITSPEPGDRALSPRERQVLRHMAEGMSVKEIAFRLEIGVKTVETYRRSLKEKLQMSNLAELTKYAIRSGIINLE